MKWKDIFGFQTLSTEQAKKIIQLQMGDSILWKMNDNLEDETKTSVDKARRYRDSLSVTTVCLNTSAFQIRMSTEVFPMLTHHNI